MAARPACSLHDVLELSGMVEPKRFDDGADLLVGGEHAFAMRIERGHAGAELAAILQVDQHAGHQPRDLLGSILGDQLRGVALSR